MFISLKHKIIYFHISRTAGTSITMMLENMFPESKENKRTIFNRDILKHRSLKRIRNNWGNFANLEPYPFKHITQTDALPFLNIAGIDTSDYFCFTVVRNPYDRFLSQLKYLNLTSKGIDHYIETYGYLDTSLSGYWYKNQVDYIKDPLSKNFAVYKFEKMYELYEKFSQLNHGCMPEIINYNKSHPKLGLNNIEISLTLQQKKKIYNMFQLDFETFGYERGFPYSSGL